MLDPAERQRLFIFQTPITQPIFVVRAPVPWHLSKKRAKEFCERSLFVSSQVSLGLQQLWCQK
ncbi:unnamed protein product [Protopolystoma xenopodis]|uniref:Uncharacterized protein n=1 Tax=Protopolystoma xenopodis TaxID=117903 RepID=A0A3S5AP60_9PLAT|nr:unnamed protein product [Protopolystoma xenopodis]